MSDLCFRVLGSALVVPTPAPLPPTAAPTPEPTTTIAPPTEPALPPLEGFIAKCDSFPREDLTTAKTVYLLQSQVVILCNLFTVSNADLAYFGNLTVELDTVRANEEYIHANEYTAKGANTAFEFFIDGPPFVVNKRSEDDDGGCKSFTITARLIVPNVGYTNMSNIVAVLQDEASACSVTEGDGKSTVTTALIISAAAVISICLLLTTVVVLYLIKIRTSQSGKSGSNNRPMYFREPLTFNMKEGGSPQRRFSLPDKDWLIGARDFRLVGSKLGQGTLGVVYKGIWRGNTVAIKQCTNLGDPEYVLDVVKNLASIPQHDNVMQMYAFCVERARSRVSIVMEYLNGGCLAAIAYNPQTRLTDEDALVMARGIATGLKHLHDHGILHKNVSCRNIMLNSEGIPKITDYSVLELFDGTVQTGPVKWMAPEALDGEYTEASDTWSFGILVWELVAGEEPHSNENSVVLGYKILNKGLKPKIPKDTDKTLKHIMEICWKRPSQRPTMGKIIATISKVAPEKKSTYITKLSKLHASQGRILSGRNYNVSSMEETCVSESEQVGINNNNSSSALPIIESPSGSSKGVVSATTDELDTNFITKNKKKKKKKPRRVSPDSFAADSYSESPSFTDVSFAPTPSFAEAPSFAASPATFVAPDDDEISSSSSSSEKESEETTQSSSEETES